MSSDYDAALRRNFVAIGNPRNRLSPTGRATGYVYALFSGQHMKIGYTKGDPRLRVAALQTGNPARIILGTFMPGNMAWEDALHGRLRAFRVRGEWFLRNEESKAILEAALMEIAGLNNHWDGA